MGAENVRKAPVLVTLGNPNTGKSTLFNALTGLKQKVGNFPGVTVEHVVGAMRLGERDVSVVDLPGTYSISAQSPDEIVAVDVLQGRVAEIGVPDAVLLIVDATNLRRNLFLASQVLEMELPVVVALNMTDLATTQGISIDVPGLAAALGVPVVPIVAAKSLGLGELKAALLDAIERGEPARLRLNAAIHEAARAFAAEMTAAGHPLRRPEAERILIDRGGFAEKRLLAATWPVLEERLATIRAGLAQGRDLATLEARDRYGWINQIVGRVEQRGPAPRNWGQFADRWLNHPVYGALLFLFAMAAVFQSVFAGAAPIMTAIDRGTRGLSAGVLARLEPGVLSSFLVDGVIAGVGSVVVFLPQILILFAFIILLEDSGYMSRAAFLVDRLMRWCGLSGQSFIPMLSSFACAVPGIMGTRVIGNYRDRLVTILAAPFMTCSARLPIYTLLISAFVPDHRYLGGLVNLQGLVLLAFYLLGIVGAVGTAFLINKTFLRGPPTRFLLEMPPYRLPNARSLVIKLVSRVKIFLKRAGTMIFGVAILVWALATFPRADISRDAARPTAHAATVQLEQSYLARVSRSVSPLFAPLGWDWKVTAAVLASFPAREVVIAVLGTLYAVENNQNAGPDATLISRMKEARRPDGTPMFSLPMALGLMMFYALCLQCVSTIAVMRRETNGWRWPAIAWSYMTALGYLGAFACYQLGTALGA
ncbi:MAG: ferrous iron transport protein B [Gammaproteobacteria bacterium]|nr:ferrous iron transport protein B [Gammaproteobacteria bacterium]